MSSQQLELAAPESRKRRASIALSQPPSPPKPSKLPKAGASTDLDTPCLPSSSPESDELGPNEFDSDEPGFDVLDFNEPESDWPESDEPEHGAQEQQDSHPIENAITSSLTFRMKVLPDDEFDWLNTIVGKATYAANTPDAKDIGHACAKLIKRNRIRQSFHEDMEAPSQDTSQLAFDLFDCYGCLKTELIEHCVKKGSGAWGNEMDLGDILLVETVTVDKDWRRKGVGAKLVKNIWRKAKKLNRNVQFAFVWATQLITGEVRNNLECKSEADRRANFDEHEATAIAFYRSLGYRRVGSTVWFCFAANPDHTSHKIATADDFGPRRNFPDDSDSEKEGDEGEASRLGKLQQKLAVHHAINVLPDVDCVAFLDQRRVSTLIADATWKAVDHSGNTILHLAAILSKPKSFDWIVDSGHGAELTIVRNHEGYTPLEALQSLLESNRVKKELLGFDLIRPVSNEFRGFSDESVLCLLKLRGMRDLTMEEIARVKARCTCGECIEGFLSPRMSLALLCQAEITNDMLNADISDGAMWCTFNEYCTTHIRQDVRNNLQTNKSMRQGFSNMFDHVAKCLRTKQVPDGPNVLQVMRNYSEWPPVTKNFLERGGRVSDALNAIFDHAMDQDEKAGDGDFMETFGDQVRELKKCRNDHEFGFVRFYCGAG